MAQWDNKTFRVLIPLKEAWEASKGRKGGQMYAISAAMLWYLAADQELREEMLDLVRRVEKEVMEVGDAIGQAQPLVSPPGAVDPARWAERLRRAIEILESDESTLGEALDEKLGRDAKAPPTRKRGQRRA